MTCMAYADRDFWRAAGAGYNILRLEAFMLYKYMQAPLMRYNAAHLDEWRDGIMWLTGNRSLACQ